MSSQPVRIVRSNPSTLSAPPGYSHVVEATGGRTVWVAGQVPLDADGKLVGAGDAEAQVQQVFRNLEAALAVAGAGFADVVKLTTFVTGMTVLPAFRAARDRHIERKDAAASTLVQVVALVHPEFLIEIEAVAVVAA
jgi:enamine deaminase RidA (YjgF/YER057c/UK114 family)